MVEQAELEAMTEDEVLDTATATADAIWQGEVAMLRIAYQWAVLHSADRLDPAEAAKPGREKARRIGGDGVPEVTEFAAAQLGLRIGRSPWAARQLMADAQDLHHRHPQLWARVQAGEVRASYARHVTARTRDLSKAEAGFVDAGVVESADGRIPWSRFETLVAAKVAQAAPELAREKEERARRASFARKLRGEAHGMASFLVRADAATIETIEAAVSAKADQVRRACPDAPDLQTDDQRRVRATLLLATGTDLGTDLAEVLPSVQLVVHCYAGDDREPLMRFEGHGPVTEAWVRTVLGPRARFTILPVLDLAGQAPVDSYEIPERHRQAVRMMTPADTFPYASCTAPSMQVDHSVPYDEGGISGIGNYGPMATFHHRVKTHGGVEVRQPFPGIYVWRDPGGAFFLVDHTGTRRLPAPAPAPGPAPDPTGRAPRPPLTVELWHTPYEIHVDLAA